MILRIVKMHFKPEHLSEFMAYFKQIRSDIEAMPGMVKLKLYQDADNDNVVFTHSQWLNQESLNNYRGSALFGQVWPKTKSMFEEKAEAWSLNLK